MVDYQKAKDIIDYVRQDLIKRFGKDELLLPFEPRCLTDALRNKKYFIDTNSDKMVLTKKNQTLKNQISKCVKEIYYENQKA